MAVAVITEFPGGTQELYETVQTHLDFPDGWIPDGLIAHTAGPVDDGWRVIDIWRSAEDFDSQIPPRIMPIIEEYAAQTGMLPPEPTISIEPLHSVFSLESAAVQA